MKHAINNESIKQLFTEARSHHSWKNETVSDEILRQIYDLAKWGPTSLNSVPMRIVFVKSEEQKKNLLPSLMGSNIEQVKAAPVTAIIAYDQKFFDELPKLFPAMDVRPMFQGNAAMSEATAFRNSSMQGGYFILAARALGVDVGPMSGFDNAKVDENFFKGTTWKSNFLCNLGYGDSAKLFPRGPRLEFDLACKVV